MQGTDDSFAASVFGTLDLLDRQILVLRYAEKLSVQEIAMILSCSHGEVEHRLNQIRDRTRAALAAWSETSRVA